MRTTQKLKIKIKIKVKLKRMMKGHAYGWDQDFGGIAGA